MVGITKMNCAVFTVVPVSGKGAKNEERQEQTSKKEERGPTRENTNGCGA